MMTIEEARPRQADDLLRRLLERVDYIGKGQGPESHTGLSVFLLVTIEEGIFLELCRFGAATEDEENDDPAEHDDIIVETGWHRGGSLEDDEDDDPLEFDDCPLDRPMVAALGAEPGMGPAAPRPSGGAA